MKISVKKLLFGLLFFQILFLNIIQSYISFWGYMDEIVAIFSILYVFTHLKKLNNNSIVLLVLITLMGILALVGNFIYGYQSSGIAVLKDILAFVKMPITFIAVYIWSKDRTLNCAHDIAVKISKIATIVIFIGCVASLFVDIGLSYGIRMGFRTYRFLYTHPTYLVYTLVVMSTVLVSDMKKRDNNKVNWIMQIMILICILFTFRDKGFAYIALFSVIMILLPRHKKIKMRYFVLVGIIAYIVSYDKIMEYQSWPWSPRAALYVNGFQIALQSFPLGSGFATFNSFVSGEYYSKVYSLFGLDKKPGLNPMDYINITDAQIPYYYSQFGILGFILFIVLLYIMFRMIKNYFKSDLVGMKSAYLVIGYLVIGSLVEAVFTNETGVTSVMVLFFYCNRNKAIEGGVNNSLCGK